MRPGGLPINVLTFIVNVNTFYEGLGPSASVLSVKPDEDQNCTAHPRSSQEIWKDLQATWVECAVGVRLCSPRGWCCPLCRQRPKWADEHPPD